MALVMRALNEEDNMRDSKTNRVILKTGSVSLMAMMAMVELAQAAPLFENQGQAIADSRAHISSRQAVKINRGSLNQATLDFNLDGEAVTAVRRRQVKGENGNLTWIGYLQGSPANTVVLTARGNAYSGVIQSPDGTYEIAGARNGIQYMDKIDLSALPQEDQGMSDEMLGHVSPVTNTSTAQGDLIHLVCHATF